MSSTRRQALIFRAIADPTRRAILELLLRERRLAAGDIAQRFPVSRPAISRHLRLLRRAALVHERREGRKRLYQLDPRPLVGVDRWLEPYRRFWGRRLQRLKEYLESESGEDSETKEDTP